MDYRDYLFQVGRYLFMVFLFSLISGFGFLVGGLLYLIFLDDPSRPWWLGFLWSFASALVTLTISWNLVLRKP